MTDAWQHAKGIGGVVLAAPERRLPVHPRSASNRAPSSPVRSGSSMKTIRRETISLTEPCMFVIGASRLSSHVRISSTGRSQPHRVRPPQEQHRSVPPITRSSCDRSSLRRVLMYIVTSSAGLCAETPTAETATATLGGHLCETFPTDPWAGPSPARGAWSTRDGQISTARSIARTKSSPLRCTTWPRISPTKRRTPTENRCGPRSTRGVPTGTPRWHSLTGPSPPHQAVVRGLTSWVRSQKYSVGVPTATSTCV